MLLWILAPHLDDDRWWFGKRIFEAQMQQLSCSMRSDWGWVVLNEIQDAFEVQARRVFLRDEDEDTLSICSSVVYDD